MPKENPGPSLKWRKERQVWEVVWFERGRRRRKSTATADGREAQEVLADIILGKEPAGPRDPTERRIADVLAAYIDEHLPKVAAPQRLLETVTALQPFWGNKVVDDTTEATCEAYGRFRGVSPGTIRRELTTLRAAMRHDHNKKRLTELRKVYLPPKPKPDSGSLERHEVAAIIRAARRLEQRGHKQRRRSRGYLPFYVLMLFYTGARKSYPLQVRAPQVDLRAGLIDFNLPGVEATNKRRPIVPIASPLMTFVRRRMKLAGATGPLVADVHGRPFKSLRHAFAEAVRTAGLDPRHVTPKRIRHTFASLAIRNGVKPWLVAEALGHANSSMVEEVYGHLKPENLREVVDHHRRRA